MNIKDQIDINNIPLNIKSWKSLSQYNKRWDFISNDNRYRICESLSALDYFFSLYEWLKPGLVFAEVHRRMILMIVASIYECVLADAVSRTARQELSESKILKQYIKKEKVSNIEKDEFETLINNGCDIGLYEENWKDYLHKIREVRNWIHLSKTRDKKLIEWFRSQKTESFKNNLEKFRNLSQTYLSKIWTQ